MRLQIQSYREDLAEAVREFNARLRAAGFGHPIGLPEDPSHVLPPKRSGQLVYQECFIATEGETVRGGYTLYYQTFSFRGEDVAVANCVMPVSEGIIDRNYGLVGIQLVQDALRRQPRMFGFGMGGVDGPMTKLLKAMNWDVWPVPFYFKVLNGARFLRNIRLLRRTRAGALLADVAAFCGVGKLGARLTNLLLTRKGPERVQVETIDGFSSWADEMWERARMSYKVLSVRDSGVLNALYGDRAEFARLRISEGGRTLGWAVVEMHALNWQRFGDMTVGYVLDCLALPEDAPTAARGIAEWLASRGADLIVSNQSHSAWQAALRRSGFVRGPTTWVFASAPALMRLLRTADPSHRGMHFPRGIGAMHGWAEDSLRRESNAYVSS